MPHCWMMTRVVLAVLTSLLAVLATVLLAQAYQEPELPVEHPEACFVADLTAPCVPMPVSMARDAWASGVTWCCGCRGKARGPTSSATAREGREYRCSTWTVTSGRFWVGRRITWDERERV